MARLSLSLLGSPQVISNGETITDFATDKVRALLVYLAVEMNRPHRRDELAGLLWPDQPQRKARHSLRQALSNLRQTIGDREGAAPFLCITRETVQFDVASDHWLDVAAFTTLVNACRAHRHRRLDACRPCMRRLEEAVELYQGDFLAGFSVGDSAVFEEWALLQREWLHRLAVEALSHLADYHERRGDSERARRYAWRQVALEPWREEAHRRLMRLLAQRGQRGAALAQYETCRRALAEELGVEPTHETTVLYGHIRAGEFFSPPTPLHNLPPSPTPFVGREEELEELAELLADPDRRLLSLVGPGGIGKTRLALQAAQEQVGAFLDGVYFVSLAPISSVEFLLPTLANALNFSFQGRQDPQEQLLGYLREKDLLLVLDNLEHLLESTEFLAQVLRRASGVALLVTSRERLNLQEEWVYRVEGLSYPQDEAALDVEACSAIELFQQSARRVRRDFVLTEQKLPHVVRICRLVEGMPLAIELAAAGTAVCALRDIAQDIEHNLDALSTFMRNVPARHRSVRATFEHSWNLLDEQERQAFARLSVFQGGFERQAAQQVAQASLAILTTLIHKSLLRCDASGRYEVHQLLRQYATERLLEARQQKEVRDRHCVYYAAFLQGQEQALQGEGQKKALDTISLEIENVRVAWKRAIAHLADRSQAIEMSLESLRLFYDMRSWFQEGKETFGQVAEALEQSDDSDGEQRRLLGRVLARRGGFCFRLGLYERARELLQKSVAIFRDLDERAELASALNSLGHVAHYQRGRDEAQTCYRESLAIHQRDGNLRGMAEVLNSLGVVLRVRGQYTEAKETLEQALKISRDMNNRWRAAFFLNNLGIVSRMLGEYPAAKAYYRESLEIKREFNDKRGEAITLNNLGNIAYALDELDEAEHLHRQSLAICQEIGDQQGVARSLNNLGMVAHGLARYAQAARLHQKSLAIKREIGDQRGMVHSLNHLGKAATALGECRQARQDFRQALEMAMDMQAIPLALFALEGVAELWAKEGEPEQAVELLALIVHHPASEQWTKDQATRLLAELTAELPPQRREAAEEKGKTRDLEVTVAQILRDDVTGRAHDQG